MTTSRNAADLHPALLELWTHLVPAVQQELGLSIFLTCTYRSNEEQTRLYAQGRTAGGKIVTNARAGQSAHNVRPPEGSHALDFAVSDGRGGVTWEGSKYDAVAKIAQRMGADCGAFWPNFIDRPHIQMPGWHIGKTYGPDYRFLRNLTKPPELTPKVTVRVFNAATNKEVAEGTLIGGKVYLRPEDLDDRLR